METRVRGPNQVRGLLFLPKNLPISRTAVGGAQDRLWERAAAETKNEHANPPATPRIWATAPPGGPLRLSGDFWRPSGVAGNWLRARLEEMEKARIRPNGGISGFTPAGAGCRQH